MWYPQGEDELLFVSQAYSASTKFYVGYRNYNSNIGPVFADYSLGMGIPGFTTDPDGVTPLVAEGSYLGEGDDCIVYDVNDQIFAAEAPCAATSKGICKAKLGKKVLTTGYNL